MNIISLWRYTNMVDFKTALGGVVSCALRVKNHQIKLCLILAPVVYLDVSPIVPEVS